MYWVEIDNHGTSPTVSPVYAIKSVTSNLDAPSQRSAMRAHNVVRLVNCVVAVGVPPHMRVR